MKKKILFVIPEYSHGGTNKVLENLLLLINKNIYDINIFCLYQDGGNYYKKVFAPYNHRSSILYYFVHDNYFTRKLANIVRQVIGWKDWNRLYLREVNILQKKNYDTVIAFQEGAATRFVSLFGEPNKVAWIHYDYGSKYWTNHKQNELKLYNNFDKIVCVSNNAAQTFSSTYPELQERTIAIHNVMDVDTIIRKSYESLNASVINDEVFSIISIGRFVKVKQFEIIPHIASRIKQLCHIPFKWFIIGSGDEMKNTINQIRENGLEDTVILLGSQNNPYTYIRKCHLLVCTSHSESYPTVINEAKIIGVPVISNDFPAAKEVIDEDCGWISNVNDMPELIANILIDKNNIYSTVKDKIRDFDYNIENNKILNTLYTILYNNH